MRKSRKKVHRTEGELANTINLSRVPDILLGNAKDDDMFGTIWKHVEVVIKKSTIT